MVTYKSILITGATSGIGRALALYYAASGITLCLTGRDEQRLAQVTEECVGKGAVVYAATVDVTDRMGMRAWITGCDDMTPLDLVIANAGISGGTGGSRHSDWVSAEHDIFDVNVSGVLNTILPAIERMTGRRSGRVALVSSLAGFSGWPGAPAYSTSKAAVRIYGEALAGALKPFSVGVSVVCPGFISTPMTSVNNYKMPFMMTAEKAATIIGKGISCGKPRIAFPWPTYGFVRLISLLPAPLQTELLRRMPAKPVLTK